MDGEKKRRGAGKGGERVENEGRGWCGASDIIAEAAVATCLSRIFEMGTECEHGASVMPLYSSCLRLEHGACLIFAFLVTLGIEATARRKFYFTADDSQ